MTDIWVCGTCHSVNRQRSDKCYKCGASQAGATGQGADHRIEQAVQMRTVMRYRSALLLAFLASAMILVVAAFGIYLVLWWIAPAAYLKSQADLLASGGTVNASAAQRLVNQAAVLGLIRLALVIPAVVLFGAWLSRVISNVPALGGGIPSATPTKAFVYSVIPIVNLRKVPGMVQDALYRLDPKAGGFFMVMIAWVGFVGSWIVSSILGRWIDLRLDTSVFNAQSQGEVTRAFREAIDYGLLLDIVTAAMMAVGAVVLVIIIVRIQIRSAAREREIRAAVGV
jgi:Domain of unknown function (DUF4328)